MKTTYLITILILLVGCSNVNIPSAPGNTVPTNTNREYGNSWDWGYWLFSFSADHTQVDVATLRWGDYHYCVTKFLEETPCKDCLHIGKPLVQPDGTVKLKVTLQHPFPKFPQYTGFDVRGVVYFPPTMNQKTDLGYSSRIYYPEGSPYYGVDYFLFTGGMPLIFSRAKDGGGEVLNADGYSCYLVPCGAYSKDYPIFSYQPGKQGNEPTPQTTITPYKLFASDNSRRMFLVTDTITCEYQLALPPGPFNFGYAVDASWWPPDKTPVTDPAVDFPPEANAEDPWLIEFEQLAPIKLDNMGKDIFKTTVHHRGTDKLWRVDIYTWDMLKDYTGCPYHNSFLHAANEFIDDYTSFGCFTLTWQWWGASNAYQGNLNPGHHLGLLIASNGKGNDPKREMVQIYTAKFVDIYVEN